MIIILKKDVLSPQRPSHESSDVVPVPKVWYENIELSKMSFSVLYEIIMT